MSGDSEFTEESKKRTFQELLNFVNTHVRKNEAAAQELVKKFDEWQKVRKRAIHITGYAANFIKDLNDGIFPIQTICKAGSVAGKVAILCGPASAVIGATTSIACDAAYAFASKTKIDKLEKISTQVERVLDEDREATNELFDAMNKARRISETLENCIKKFHSGTKMGFFDNVPSLLSFVNAVKRIRDIQDRHDFIIFLKVLKEEAEGLANDPNLFPSLASLLTYNPDILDLSLTVPAILVNVGILSCRGVASGIAGGVLRGLSILGIITDAVDIVSMINKYGSYPKMAEELLKIKKKLEEGEENMSEMKKEIEKE